MAKKRQSLKQKQEEEEEEESMNQLLSDRGMLEEGMSFVEKQEFMKAIRASEDMAASEVRELQKLQPEGSEESSSQTKSNGILQHSASHLASIARSKCNSDLSQEEVVNNGWEDYGEFSDKRNVSKSERSYVLNEDSSSIKSNDNQENEEPDEDNLYIDEDSSHSATNYEEDEKNENIVDSVSKEVSNSVMHSSKTGSGSDSDDLQEVQTPKNSTIGSEKKERLSISLKTLKIGNSSREQNKSIHKPSPSAKADFDFDDLLPQSSLSKEPKDDFDENSPHTSQRKEYRGKRDQKNFWNNSEKINVWNCWKQPYNENFPRPEFVPGECFPFYMLSKSVDRSTFVERFRKYFTNKSNEIYEIQRNSTSYLEWGKPIPITVSKHGETSYRRQVSLEGSRAYNFRERSNVKRSDENLVPSNEDFYEDTLTEKPNSQDSSASIDMAANDDDDDDFEPQSSRRATKRTKKKCSQNSDDNSENVQPIKRRKNSKKSETKCELTVIEDDDDDDDDEKVPHASEPSPPSPSSEVSPSQETKQGEVNDDGDDDVAVIFDNTVRNKEDIKEVPCPICNKLFSSSEIMDHASECFQFENKDTEVSKDVDNTAKRRTRRGMR